MASFIISAFADEASDDLALQIEALKRNGLGYIEPRNANGNIIKKSDQELFEIANQLDSAGIKVSSLGSPIGKFKIDDDFETHLTEFRRALRACELLGTKNMRVFSFFVPQERLAECRPEVMRRMTVLLEEAQKAGVTLCHENESKIYGQNPEEVTDLLTSLPSLRGVFDAANFIMNDREPLEGIDATIGSLEYIHVKDAIMEKKSIVPVGMGDGCYDEVLRRVDAATDRTLFLTVEPHLHVFKAYSRIDSRQLKNEVTFASSDEAFDCAVSSLKKLLINLGYHEEENRTWKK